MNDDQNTILSRPIVGLFLISFLSGFSMGIFNPLISLLMEQHGVDQLMIGANSSLYYLTIALFAPLAGKLIQSHGIRSVTIVGILLTTTTAIAFPNTDDLIHWFVLRSLMGMGVCLYMVAGQTGLNIHAHDSRRGTIVALHGAAFGVAFMVSPVIGTIGYAHFPKLTFLIGGSAIFLGVFAVLYCLPNQLIPYRHNFSLKIIKLIAIPLQGAFIYGALEGILVTLLPIVLLHEAMPIDWIGFPLTLFMVASGIGMIPVSYFGDRFGRTIVLFFSSLIGLATLVAIGIIDHPYIVPISSTILGLTLGTLFPVTLAMIGSQLDKSEMHAGSSLFTASFSYGCAVGPIFAALCMSSLGDIYIFLPIVVFLMLLVIGMALSYLKAKRGRSIASRDTAVPMELATIISRREFLRYTVIGTSFVAIGGTYRVHSSGLVNYSDPAYQYWNKNSQGAIDVETYLVLCASLAPSAHNTQPWKFAIQERHIDVYADLTRNLGQADKDYRMMLLSIGCAIENIAVVASHLGLKPSITTTATAEFLTSGRCAEISLEIDQRPAKPHPLFKSIFKRQTTRSTYLDEPVDEQLIRSISQANDFPFLSLNWFDMACERQTLTELNKEAVRGFISDDKAYQDSLRWWRYSREEILHKRDGISIFTSTAPTVIKQYFEYLVKQPDMSGDFGKTGEVDLMDELFENTPLWGAITSNRLDHNARINAGQLLERIYLEATRQNYRVMPVAYITEQERYTEKFKRIFKVPETDELLIIVRIGKAEPCEKSVRRTLNDIVL